jgi:hypothetical protein
MMQIVNIIVGIQIIEHIRLMVSPDDDDDDDEITKKTIKISFFILCLKILKSKPCRKSQLFDFFIQVHF